MMTIAVTATHVAAHALTITDAGEVHDCTSRMLRIEAGRIYGWLGATGMRGPVTAWHQAGAKPTELPPLLGERASWRLIVIDRDGIRRYTSTCPYPVRYCPPFAFGGGDHYALGALLAGADARRALEIAAHCTLRMAGEILVIDLLEVFGAPLLTVP